MAESRTKNAVRNITYSFLNKIVVLILPFFTRTLIIYLLGNSYLGIGTLFSSILNFLSLTELGLGSAIVFFMYKPIAENDYDLIGALLKYYRKLYRIIGITMLSIGTVLVPFVPLLIKGNPPEGVNVYILYYIYLINSVISYFFAGYRQSLLTSHQRLDITSKITMIVNVAVQTLQIVALFVTKNFYVYAFVPIIGTLSTNFTNYIVTKRKYPNILCKGEITKETKNGIKKRLSGLFGTKLNSIVVHSADTVIISAFLGLELTAQYGNYYYIMSAICGFVMVLFSSMTAGIGNKIVTDGVEESYKLFRNLSYFNAWIVVVCSTCFLCLYEPFMVLWVGQENALGFWFALAMTVYFFVYDIQRSILAFKDAAGLWHKDKLRPYVSMVLNLVLNIILVNYIGIYGIVISSIIAFLISVPWSNYVLFKNVFQIKPSVNLLYLFKYLILASISCTVSYLLCNLVFDGFAGLLIRLCICLIVSNIVFLGTSIKTQEFGYLKQSLKRILHRKAK